MNSIWDTAREILAAEVTDPNYKIWIEPLQPLRLEDGALYLGCPNRFFMAWVRENYLPTINAALARANGGSCRKAELILAPVAKDEAPLKDSPQRQRELPVIEAVRRAPMRFNRRFTFDSFVVGSGNQYAYSASQAMAQGRELNTDSLYLLADPGLGKSHLSQAIGQYVLSQARSARVFYLTAEDFTNELVYSIRNKCVEDFKNKYRRNCDVLVLEEVHFLSGKEKVQAELAYTLDCLIENQSKVVFTSSRRPKDIPRLARSLASRLAGSLISCIEPPDYKTRLRILDRKAKDNGLAIPPQVMEFMAEKTGPRHPATGKRAQQPGRQKQPP